MINQYMHNGLAQFDHANFYDAKDTKNLEWTQCSQGLICLEQGKNLKKLIAANKLVDPAPVQIDRLAQGTYFYLWSKPMINYYHTMLDTVGCLIQYYRVLEQYPDTVVLINRTPRKLAKYPPFVEELLRILNIPYEFTDPTTQYKRVYYGATGAQDPNTLKRLQPGEEYWSIINKLVYRCKDQYTPVYDKVYLSRRAHANPMTDRKGTIGEDNTVKRGLVNEDAVVDILTDLGYTEVFGENYTLAQKIKMFSSMHKYISSAGAGVTNPIFVRSHAVSVGGIHTPGFPFPGPNHDRHVLTSPQSCATIDVYPGKVVFEDPQPTKGYNHPWRINNLTAFAKWAATI